VTLRPATHADVDAVSSMQRASLLETYEPFLGRAAIEEFIAGGHVEGYFEEHWHQATIAVSGDEIVGVAVLAGLLARPDLGAARIAVRGHRIGAHGRGRAPGCRRNRRADVEVWDDNRRAVAFYERRGFSVRAAAEDPQTGLMKLHMRKAFTGLP